MKILKFRKSRETRGWLGFSGVCFLLVTAFAFPNVRAYQQSSESQKDVEIMQLKTRRITELENQQASCFKRRRDPALNEPRWANEGE